MRIPKSACEVHYGATKSLDVRLRKTTEVKPLIVLRTETIIYDVCRNLRTSRSVSQAYNRSECCLLCHVNIETAEQSKVLPNEL